MNSIKPNPINAPKFCTKNIFVLFLNFTFFNSGSCDRQKDIFHNKKKHAVTVSYNESVPFWFFVCLLPFWSCLQFIEHIISQISHNTYVLSPYVVDLHELDDNEEHISNVYMEREKKPSGSDNHIWIYVHSDMPAMVFSIICKDVGMNL